MLGGENVVMSQSAPVPAEQASVAILGMGRTGCSVARFLSARGIKCIGFDEREVVLPEDVDVPLHIGPLAEADLLGFECLLVSPGISWRHPAVQRARGAGLHLCGDLEIFDEHFHGELIAVTGTNGKTTTVSLLASMLEVLPGGAEAGGNIGRPVLDLLAGGQQPARVVLELSSFQLERNACIRPRWAVLLNVQDDHADMHADVQDYVQAKLRLFARQAEGDTAMLPIDERWQELAASLAARGVRVCRFGVVEDTQQATAGIAGSNEGAHLFWSQGGGQQTIPVRLIRAKGRHQHLNMAVAAQAAADFGLGSRVIQEAMTAFAGLPHRLQSVGSFRGRLWYNDSKATNPAAAIAALNGFDQTLWICGGLRKGLDLGCMAEVVARHVVHGFVIGADPEPFVRMLEQAGTPCTIAGDIRKAVKLAASFAPAYPVLLSPAGASQDQFRDYAERGEIFMKAVRALGAS